MAKEKDKDLRSSAKPVPAQKSNKPEDDRLGRLEEVLSVRLGLSLSERDEEAVAEVLRDEGKKKELSNEERLHRLELVLRSLGHDMHAKEEGLA